MAENFEINENNLIKLFTKLSYELTKDFDSAESPKNRKIYVQALKRKAFDILLRSRTSPENFWYPSILITDEGYKLIFQGERLLGERLLESVTLCEGRNSSYLDNVWTFLLALKGSDTSKQASVKHSFSLSGEDYFFRENHPYELLPKFSSFSASNVKTINKTELFLDKFIEKRKVLPVSNYSGPSLDDFIESDKPLVKPPVTNKITHSRVEVKQDEKAPEENLLNLVLEDLSSYSTPQLLSTENLSFEKNYKSSFERNIVKATVRRRRRTHKVTSSTSGLIMGLYEEGNVLQRLIEPDEKCIIPRKITIEEYISEVKYLLCGISNNIFKFDDSSGNFILKEGVYTENLNPDGLAEVSEVFLTVGSYHRRIAAAVKDRLKEHNGILHTVFWNSVDTFLLHHWEAVAKINPSTSLMSLKFVTNNLCVSVICVYKLCCLNGALPTGGKLLSHLYEYCCSVQESHVQDALFNILRDCTLAYLSKFVEKWIYEGDSIKNVSDEFFVKVNNELLARRDRSFNLSVSIDETKVPSFMGEIAARVFACGKALWLLQSFNPENKFVHLLKSRKYPKMKLCKCDADLKDFTAECADYKKRVLETCGENVSFLTLKKKEQLEEEQRVARMNAMKRKIEEILQERKLTQLAHQREKIRAKEQILKEQLQAISEKKAREKEAKNKLQEVEKMEQEKLAADESRREEQEKMAKDEIADKYRKLNEISEKSRRQAEWDAERLALHEKRLEFFKQDVINENTAFDNEGNILPISDECTTKSSENDPNCNVLLETSPESSAVQDEIVVDVVNNNQANIEPRNVAFFEAKLNKRKILGTEFGINEESLNVQPKIPEQILTDAQRNKQKMLSSEYGIKEEAKEKSELLETDAIKNRRKVLGEYDFNAPLTPRRISPKLILTEAMKNKMKVLGTEYDLALEKDSTPKALTIAQLNKMRIMSSSQDDTPQDKPLRPLTQAQKNKMKVMGTEFGILQSPKKTTPPKCENPPEDPSPEKEESFDEESEKIIPKFFAWNEMKTVEGFFPSVPSMKNIPQDITFDSMDRDIDTFRRYLHKSIRAALDVQEMLTNGAVLTHFLTKENFMLHLSCLRCYFLHFDGEFSRNFTHAIFRALASSTEPQQIFDKSLLSGILNEALIHTNNSDGLSFQINNMPPVLNLVAHDVLAPFQLAYKIKWPLNIILNEPSIEKFRKVFHFLVNLKRVHWTLNETFLHLKIQTKDKSLDGKRLMNSPEYTKLATYRHAMTLFIMTLEEHVCEKGLQEAWNTFEQHLETVEDLDDLYQKYVAFVKDVSIRCFLVKGTQDLLSYINEMIELGLRFHFILKSTTWRLINETHYSHPKHTVLREIFMKFCETTRAFLRTLRKKTQYPDLKIHIPLLELIDVKISVN